MKPQSVYRSYKLVALCWPIVYIYGVLYLLYDMYGGLFYGYSRPSRSLVPALT